MYPVVIFIRYEIIPIRPKFDDDTKKLECLKDIQDIGFTFKKIFKPETNYTINREYKIDRKDVIPATKLLKETYPSMFISYSKGI